MAVMLTSFLAAGSRHHGQALRIVGGAHAGDDLEAIRRFRAGQDRTSKSIGPPCTQHARSQADPSSSRCTLALLGTTNYLVDVWGSAIDKVWSVGAGGTIRQWDGTSWSAQSSGTTKQLNGGRGSRANNVFAVGEEGTILYWGGASWTRQVGIPWGTGTPRGGDLNAIWGSGADKVWAVGRNNQASPSGYVLQRQK